MKTILRDDTEHGIEYVEQREAEAKIEALQDEIRRLKGEPECSSISSEVQPYKMEWTIIVKGDSMLGAMDAVWNCWEAWQKGSEPCGGGCSPGMGERMEYQVKRKHEFPQKS